ncbi:peptide methionine sulfoxide reductase MsrB-like isoform X3 [Amphiura filiformis]|uniref:peptide methionine sulfoxide reductase MsrB-like isoform X3 n=1 Tax=Amphiura filiformis TaxID=82378 RepID=UPI003B22274E
MTSSSPVDSTHHSLLWEAAERRKNRINTVYTYKPPPKKDKKMEETKIYEKKFSKEELKNRLTPLQYHITQERGTERAFTGELYKIADDGAYHCVVCDALLFKSETKFDSGCGWPSFYDMAGQGTVIFNEDSTHGMKRVETVCAKCGAHLGHVFEDGPSDKTGQRYCINSASLKFNPKKKADKSEL